MPEKQDTRSQMRETLGKKADWNMALYSFERWSKLLEQMTKEFYIFKSHNYENYDDLYAIMSTLIYELNGVMEELNIKDLTYRDFDVRLTNLNNQIKGLKKSGGTFATTTFIKDMENMFRDVHRFIQLSGINIPTRHEITEEERMKRAVD
jgi:hypothetical protein